MIIGWRIVWGRTAACRVRACTCSCCTRACPSPAPWVLSPCSTGRRLGCTRRACCGRWSGRGGAGRGCWSPSTAPATRTAKSWSGSCPQSWRSCARHSPGSTERPPTTARSVYAGMLQSSQTKPHRLSPLQTIAWLQFQDPHKTSRHSLFPRRTQYVANWSSISLPMALSIL